MLHILLKILEMLVAIFKIPFIICAVVIGVFMAEVFLIIAKRIYIDKEKLPRSGKYPVKNHSVFRRLFIDAPLQFVEDLFNRQEDFFEYQGVVIFTGRQGRGKTIGMIEYAMRMQQEYPKCKCITNLKYKYQSDRLKSWKQLLDYKNGINGVICCIDETQNWFSSKQSRNFPPEMLSVITQNRKNRRIILGTSQNFYLLAKDLRSQATQVRECFTIAKCITFVRCREPVLDCNGDVKEWKARGFYFFVHNKKLRESYDTYEVIDSLSKSGFVDRKEISVTVG